MVDGLHYPSSIAHAKSIQRCMAPAPALTLPAPGLRRMTMVSKDDPCCVELLRAKVVEP